MTTQDKWGFHPLPVPPITPAQLGKLREEQRLLMKMSYARNVPEDVRKKRQQDIDDLLHEVEFKDWQSMPGPDPDTA